MATTKQTRAQRAASQAAGYAVRIDYRSDCEVTARVENKATGKRYFLTLATDGLFHCSCPDHGHRGTEPCKHAWLALAKLEAAR